MPVAPQPSRRTVLAAAAALLPGTVRAQEQMTFAALYRSFGVLGIEYSERALALRNRDVAMSGYMAPPLKAESNFFVLTRQPLSICPFCQSDADWPIDIVVIYLRGASPLVSAGAPVTVTGRLEIGSWTDPESGFVSQVRIVDARYRAQ